MKFVVQNFSASLFAELSPKFFGVLTGANATVYLDALVLLEDELSARATLTMEREEAVTLTELWLEKSGRQWLPEEDADGDASPPARERARLVVERLREAGWLREEGRNDWRRLISLDENAAVVLGALRKIVAQQSGVARFSDKLVNACLTVSGRDFALAPLAQLNSCASLIADGLKELGGMGRSILRHTKRQLDTATLQDNLELVFTEFSEKISAACYMELVRARLPARLAEAQQALDKIHADGELLDKMQAEVLARESERGAELDAATAMARVRNEIDGVSQLLERVVPLADEIDRRAADFVRKSLARFRYLREMAGKQRETVQAFFEKLNAAFADKTYHEMAPLADTLPLLLIPDAKWPSGRESLMSPRLRRAAGEIEALDDADDELLAQRARNQLENAIRTSITLGRANRFVSGLAGARIASRDLRLSSNEDDVGDLIACLLHAHSARAAYRIELSRETSADGQRRFDRVAGLQLESFVLIKSGGEK